MKSKLILSAFLLFFGSAIAQELNISGTVFDGSNAPLPGVSILVKGTNIGTATDFDGNFTLDGVSESSVLVFSYVGFADQEITVTSAAPMTVVLQEDTEALDEVIVIGYGTQSKKEITGAVSVVGSETIAKLNPVRIEQALQGQVAGVSITAQSGSPGSASNIRIRGVTTNGNNNPLILYNPKYPYI